MKLPEPVKDKKKAKATKSKKFGVKKSKK